VMGPLVAAGGIFDAIWFLHGGELSWPMETTSSPLLPWPMQRDLGMPGTDVARDSEIARSMTKRIANCARTMVFSYAKQTTDSVQRPSALLTSLELEEIDAAEVAGVAIERSAVELEVIDDVRCVKALPEGPVRGGARVLELQAACGFRAFAELRLRATDLESIDPGMDARESGTVVHEALQVFWDAVHTQDDLKLMSKEERDGMVEWSIREALKRTDDAAATAWDAAYLEVQRARLARLLNGWLDLELERVLPFTVRGSERESKDVKVGPLRLNVRMDRIDEVEGGEVLIDYKTGLAAPSDWLSERPNAPQLPLYAILSEAERLKGVAFGLVRAGDGKALKGYAVSDGILPGRRTNLKEASTLQAQVERWRQVLEGLAEEFYAGDARVKPKQYPVTCEYCEQRLLCRLDVSLLEDSEEDGDAADEVERG
jgi:ATP-dependent helicase/nuclease subunit B